MNIIKEIENHFENINKIFFEKEGEFSFLKIEINSKDLKEITKISREINEFVDKNDSSKIPFYLDIYSSGTENETDKTKLKDHIGKNILVKLKQNIKEKNSFEGELLEVNSESILVKWNAKGQFRKQSINLENISQVNFSAKIKKIRGKNEKRRI